MQPSTDSKYNILGVIIIDSVFIGPMSNSLQNDCVCLFAQKKAIVMNRCDSSNSCWCIAQPYVMTSSLWHWHDFDIYVSEWCYLLKYN